MVLGADALTVANVGFVEVSQLLGTNMRLSLPPIGGPGGGPPGPPIIGGNPGLIGPGPPGPIIGPGPIIPISCGPPGPIIPSGGPPMGAIPLGRPIDIIPASILHRSGGPPELDEDVGTGLLVSCWLI